MANGAAAWPLERETAVAFACLMTDEARKFLVPRMWKAVGRSRRCGWRSDCKMKCRRARCIEGSSFRFARRCRRRSLGTFECQPDLAGNANISRRENLVDLRHSRSSKCLKRIERKRWFELAARAYASVATFAVARIGLCSMRTVARQALRPDALVRRADVEGLVAPVGMTARCLTRFRRDFRCLLLVRVVAHSALPRMRILLRVEIREDLLHVVAAEALRCAGHKRAAC